ncbi:MAG: asparagine synthase C-terminal domain-containing protein [Gammaproteobacteria bacterium]|nr:asparagine synthase C-terminal domain-containing protein [Gammaproteobacteria bacterium]MBU2435846.1 asparagine synthase C-terminal domain-containing protein [Gammaproteobacteria bacterium]MBU2449373.1 asparagine synthase C-terminal domain-containing protein [Gammaproteobacteria bacterium]
MNMERTTLINSEFFSGRPSFQDASIAECVGSQGVLAAWHAGFSREGARMLDGVQGDFAVGLHLEDGKVFLAVDRFAIRSLCYRLDGNQLLFAERADDLAGPGCELDPQAIYDYFYFHFIPSPRTIFKGVFRLPPGHYAVFENGRLKIERYWVPKFIEPAKGDFGSLRDEFLELLKHAVADTLDGSKPGCFLSGGTDSSTVAGMIGKVCGKPAATFSIGFDAEGFDEMEYARIAAHRFGTEHHEYYVTPEDLIRSIPAVACHYDQPFGNSSALPAYYCAKMASEGGLTRILAGDGGDELFGGNARYAKQKVFGLYNSIPNSLRTGVIEPGLLETPLGRAPFFSKAASYVRQARVPLPDRTQTYNLMSRLGVRDILTPNFLEQVDLGEPLLQQKEIWREIGAASQLNHELAFDWRYTLAECDLPKVVGTTALAGIQVGFPMLNEKLVNFSMRLPNHYKLNGLKLRWFFKEALRGFLPDETIAKKKKGFGLPFGVWAAKNIQLRTMAEDSVQCLVDRKIMRADFVDALFTKHLYEHPSYYGEMIWISVMLAQWLDGHPLSTSN